MHAAAADDMPATSECQWRLDMLPIPRRDAAIDAAIVVLLQERGRVMSKAGFQLAGPDAQRSIIAEADATALLRFFEENPELPQGSADDIWRASPARLMQHETIFEAARSRIDAAGNDIASQPPPHTGHSHQHQPQRQVGEAFWTPPRARDDDGPTAAWRWQLVQEAVVMTDADPWMQRQRALRSGEPTVLRPHSTASIIDDDHTCIQAPRRLDQELDAAAPHTPSESHPPNAKRVRSDGSAPTMSPVQQPPRFRASGSHKMPRRPSGGTGTAHTRPFPSKSRSHWHSHTITDSNAVVCDGLEDVPMGCGNGDGDGNDGDGNGDPGGAGGGGGDDGDNDDADDGGDDDGNVPRSEGQGQGQRGGGRGGGAAGGGGGGGGGDAAGKAQKKTLTLGARKTHHLRRLEASPTAVSSAM